MRTVIIVPFMLLGISFYGQNREELFSFNYSLSPMGNNNVDLHNTEIKINIPVKLNEATLINSIVLNNLQLNYDNNNFSTEELDQFYNINYTLKYINPINKKWWLSTSSGISIMSNLTNSLSSEDIVFNGDFTVIRRGNNPKKPSWLKFGVGYVTLTGEPKILPLISFTKQVNNEFSYSLGFPITYAKYKFCERHALKSTISIDGFYGNLSHPVFTDINISFDKAKFTHGSLGLEYSYWMGDNWTITLKGGYSIFNNYELLEKDSASTYDFNMGANLSFSTGIKLNLKKNKRNNNEKQ